MAGATVGRLAGCTVAPAACLPGNTQLLAPPNFPLHLPTTAASMLTRTQAGHIRSGCEACCGGPCYAQQPPPPYLAAGESVVNGHWAVGVGGQVIETLGGGGGGSHQQLHSKPKTVTPMQATNTSAMRQSSNSALEAAEQPSKQAGCLDVWRTTQQILTQTGRGL